MPQPSSLSLFLGASRRLGSRARTLSSMLLLMVTTACASSAGRDDPELNPDLYRAGPDSLTVESFDSFDQYRDRARTYVDNNLVPVAGFARAQQVAWNLPFRVAAAGHCPAHPSKGVLLVHGLSDSPFMFRDLAEALSAQCIEVRSILLQGHGTRPGDLVSADMEIWREQVRSHFAALAADVDNAFIGGFSLGGALVTDYALSGQTPVPSGLIALAPAWELNGLKNYLWLAGLADVFADFVEKEPELNPVKYESVTLNAGAQMAQVLTVTQARIEDQEEQAMPLFLVATEADSVIDLSYLTRQFTGRFSNPRNRMLVFRDTRQAWPDSGLDDRIRSLNSYLPDRNILEFSHQSLAIAPTNELYGVGAPLQRCLEPNDRSPEACAQLAEGELWFSAWHDEPRPVATSRLTYNPWFDTMVSDLLAFIEPPATER